MKKFALVFALVAAVVGLAPNAEACSSCHGGMVGVGRFGAVRPAWFGPAGRYPKLKFATPVRRALGMPGTVTPVRQFALGRGATRRINRRAALFGRCFRC